MRRRLLPLLLLPCLLLTGCWQDAALTEEEPYPEDLTPQEEEVIPLPEALSLPWYNGVTLDPITCPDGTQQTVAALSTRASMPWTPRSLLSPGSAPRPSAMTTPPSGP